MPHLRSEYLDGHCSPINGLQPQILKVVVLLTIEHSRVLHVDTNSALRVIAQAIGKLTTVFGSADEHVPEMGFVL